MKRIFTLLIFGLAASSAYCSLVQKAGTSIQPLTSHAQSDEGIDFPIDDWENAMKRSKNEDKLIFLDCYTSWCGPCKWMAKNTFTNPKVGAFFNDHFINMKLDMEKDQDGVRLAEKFKIMAYPTLLFIDKNEKEVRRSVGALNVKELLALGKQVADS